MRPDLKKVIDNNDIFQILVPVTWRYWTMEGPVQSFEDNEPGGDSDCFQLSITSLTEVEKTEMSHLLGYLPQTLMGDFDCRSHPDTKDDGYVTKSWSTIYNSGHVYFTYTYSTDPEDGFYEDILPSKLQVVYSAFASFYMIEDEEREE